MPVGAGGGSCCHWHDGVSDEEKKKTSDNFELHLELVESRNIVLVAVLIRLFLHQWQTSELINETEVLVVLRADSEY